MGSECNDIPDKPARGVLCNSGEANDDHLVVCCDLGEPDSTSLSDDVIEQCVVAPMLRYGAIPLPDAGSELFFEFVGGDSQAYCSARAALEVAARLRNHSAANRSGPCIRLGIACHRQVEPLEASRREALIHRARAASKLARDSEIIAERALACVLDVEASCSALPVSGTGIQFVTLHGMRDGRSRMLQARRQTRAVIGRADELERVQTIADAVFAGQGQVVGMSGRAGAGKTFLLSNIADSWIHAGGTGFISRCKPSTQRRSLHPVYSCLFGLAGMHGNEDTTTRGERIMSALQALGGSREELQILEEVVRGGHGDQAPYHLLADWLATVIEKQTRSSPVLQIFEDLHFADPATLRFISTLAQVAHRGRVLVIASYRASRSLGNLRRSLHAEVLLSPMEASDMAKLACLHARAKSLDPGLIQYLLASGGGAPGRLIDLIRHLESRDLLVCHDDRLSLAPGSRGQAARLVTELAEQTPVTGSPLLSMTGQRHPPRMRPPRARTLAGCSSESFARRPTSRTR